MTAISVLPQTDQDHAELHFAAGVPGFPLAKSFTVKPWGTEPSPFLVLECHEVVGLRFVAVRPAVFFPGYEPRFAPEVFPAVDAGGPDDVLVLVILTLHGTAEKSTANLLGPLVINKATGQAVQAVLSGSGHSPAAPIVSRP
ncbi:MAG: flagellar assembly protein FliW [Acidimicrobiales bacterium]|jgi:flagellar assembly factor FliW